MKLTNLKYLLFGLVLGVCFFASPSLSSAIDNKQMIQSLMEQIKALQAQLIYLQNNPDISSSGCYDFNNNLRIGDKGKEIIALHKALENDGLVHFDRGGDNFNAFEVFTEETASAVVGFQQKYKNEILTPNGLQYGTGFVGKSTRAKLNKLYGCGGDPQLISSSKSSSSTSSSSTMSSSSSSSSSVSENRTLKIITSIDTDDSNAWGEVTNYNLVDGTNKTDIFDYSFKNLCGTYGHNPTYKTKYRSYGNGVCEVYYPVGSVVDLTVGNYGSFNGVSLSGENCSGGHCLVVMNGSKTIYARFNKEKAFIETLSPTRGSIWTTGQTYQVKWETSGIKLDSQGYILLKSITPHTGHYVVEKSVALNGGASSNYGGSRNFIVPSTSASFPAGYYVIRIGLGRYEDYDEARARSVFFDSVPFEIVTVSN